MTILLVSLAIIIGLVLNGAIIFGFTRAFRITSSTFWYILLISIVSSIITGVLTVVAKYAASPILISALISIVIPYLVLAIALKKKYATSWLRSLGVYVSAMVTAVILGIVISVPIRLFVMEPFVVAGDSMSPHLKMNSYIFINKLDTSYSRDTVIVFKRPSFDAYLIKRIVGLPGEHIFLKGGKLSINGITLEDAYLKLPIEGESDAILGNDEYFVIGDNTSRSQDSRHYGPIRKSDIIGIVFN